MMRFLLEFIGMGLFDNQKCIAESLHFSHCVRLEGIPKLLLTLFKPSCVKACSRNFFRCFVEYLATSDVCSH